MHGSWNGGGWEFAVLCLSLVFLALVAVGVVLLVRPSSHDGGMERKPENNRALDVLDERFARGEIDREDYEERRRVLTEGR